MYTGCVPCTLECALVLFALVLCVSIGLVPLYACELECTHTYAWRIAKAVGTGIVLVWDATCTDTFALSHVAMAVKGHAEEMNHSDMLTLALPIAGFFHPVAIET